MVAEPMRVVGVLPLRHLDDAKGRLGVALSLADRRGLALGLVGRAVEALLGGGVERVRVITRDESLFDLLLAPRVEVSLQQADGLNGAIREGQRWARAQGADALLVMLPDLPLVAAPDVRALLDLAATGGAVLAPDRAGSGTNALLLAPPDAIAPAFGEDSAARHRRALQAAGMSHAELRRTGLALDLDTADDLAQLAALGYVRRDCWPAGRVLTSLVLG
jgi:2-phospho-L-lactate guanylyltransferase